MMWYQRHCLVVLLVLLILAVGCRRSQPTPQNSGSGVAISSSKSDAVLVDASSVQGVPDSNQGVRVVTEKRSMPSQTEICNSDLLLLSVYEFDTLYGSPLPKVCCSEGIKLKAAWQCEHDWPSSDVPTCARLTTLAKRMYAFADDPPSWFTPAHRRRVIVNAGRLRSLATSKSGCTP